MSKDPMRDEIPPGTLYMLILKTLARGGEMHGFEIARAVRALDRDYHPRIVIITGIYKSTQYQNDAQLRYGINDYLIKPVKKEAAPKAKAGVKKAAPKKAAKPSAKKGKE